MHTFVWGWSRSQRLRMPRVIVAPDDKTARKMIREEFNLRSTRGISIVPKLIHDMETERYIKVGFLKRGN